MDQVGSGHWTVDTNEWSYHAAPLMHLQCANVQLHGPSQAFCWSSCKPQICKNALWKCINSLFWQLHRCNWRGVRCGYVGWMLSVECWMLSVDPHSGCTCCLWWELPVGSRALPHNCVHSAQRPSHYHSLPCIKGNLLEGPSLSKSHLSKGLLHITGLFFFPRVKQDFSDRPFLRSF